MKNILFFVQFSSFRSHLRFFPPKFGCFLGTTLICSKMFQDFFTISHPWSNRCFNEAPFSCKPAWTTEQVSWSYTPDMLYALLGLIHYHIAVLFFWSKINNQNWNIFIFFHDRKNCSYIYFYFRIWDNMSKEKRWTDTNIENRKNGKKKKRKKKNSLYWNLKDSYKFQNHTKYKYILHLHPFPINV